MNFTNDQKHYLLNLARQTLEDYFDKHQKPSVDIKKIDLMLTKPAATFVTLTKKGELRGCIGSLLAKRPLYEDIINNSLLAAFSDSRFPQVEKNELYNIKIEISVLSKALPYQYHDISSLLKAIEPQEHGVIIQNGFNQATFLPQVWEELSNAEQFLSHLCQKAGLNPNQWKKNVEIKTYTVEKISSE